MFHMHLTSFPQQFYKVSVVIPESSDTDLEVLEMKAFAQRRISESQAF